MVYKIITLSTALTVPSALPDGAHSVRLAPSLDKIGMSAFEQIHGRQCLLLV